MGKREGLASKPIRPTRSAYMVKASITGYLSECAGVYHLAYSGSPSRLEWAKCIIKFDSNKEEQRVQHILPASSNDFSTPALHLANSSLESKHFSQTVSIRIPDWQGVFKLALGSVLSPIGP